MFEYWGMNSQAVLTSLQQRITEMQPLRIDERSLPTHPALRPLLPEGALRAGASYSVQGSWQLALSFLSAPSTAGAWCGIIGCPAFGAEAAAALGIALDRCILIPDPGSDATAIAGTLSEVLGAVLLCPPRGTRPGNVERISAKLREHHSTLIVTAEWPRCESSLTVTDSRWYGLGLGHGRLASRELSVRSVDRRGTRTHSVRFTAGTIASPEYHPAQPEQPQHRLVAL